MRSGARQLACLAGLVAAVSAGCALGSSPTTAMTPSPASPSAPPSAASPSPSAPATATPPSPSGAPASASTSARAELCVPTSAGLQTTAPVSPGPTSLPVQSLPGSGDLARGHYYRNGLYLAITAPCWTSDADAYPFLDVALHLAQVPANRLVLTVLSTDPDEMCSLGNRGSGSSIGPGALDSWLTSRPYLRVEPEAPTTIGTEVVPAHAWHVTLVGAPPGCAEGRLRGMPFASEGDVGASGELITAELPSDGVALIAITSAIPSDLPGTRGLADAVLSSVEFNMPVP